MAFIMWRPWLAPFLVPLVQRLLSEYRIRLYVRSKGEIAIVAKRFGANNSPEIVPFHQLYSVAQQRIDHPDAVVRRAREHEEWLGRTFSSLSVSDRHFGRGFALGGPRFPTSPQSRVDRVQMLNAFSQAVEFWRNEFERHCPSMVIVSENVLAAVAERYRVPVREPTNSRHENYFYWAHNWCLETEELAPKWNELVASRTNFKEYVVDQASVNTQYSRATKKVGTRLEMIRKICLAVARRGWSKLRRRTGGTSYDLSSTIAYIARQRRQIAKMTCPGLATGKSLEGKRFVYFPLATEPETTLQDLSPEYFFQLETIGAIARDLPADVWLIVKEHRPACGARADVFYEQIEAFKGVRFADLRERGVDLVRQADVTVTIAGSAGFESAAMGKPTIVLGRHNIYDFLPHVRRVEDIAELPAALSDALEGRLAGPHAKRHGAALLSAIAEISWDMEMFDPFSPEIAVSERVIEEATRRLETSLHKQHNVLAVEHPQEVDCQ